VDAFDYNEKRKRKLYCPQYFGVLAFFAVDMQFIQAVFPALFDFMIIQNAQ